MLPHKTARGQVALGKLAVCFTFTPFLSEHCIYLVRIMYHFNR